MTVHILTNPDGCGCGGAKVLAAASQGPAPTPPTPSDPCDACYYVQASQKLVGCGGVSFWSKNPGYVSPWSAAAVAFYDSSNNVLYSGSLVIAACSGEGTGGYQGDPWTQINAKWPTSGVATIKLTFTDSKLNNATQTLSGTQIV